MEWLRTCYTGQWRLFRGQPGIVTPGRYVRVPLNTPHYPGFHNLGSRRWRQGNGEEQPALGELDNSAQQWSTGAAGGAVPPAVVVGSQDCISQGGRWPLPVIDREFVNGFDSRCFAGFLPSTFPGNCTQVSIRNPNTLLFFATLLQTLYADAVAAKTALLSYLGPGAVGDAVGNSSSLVPGSVVCYNGRLGVAAISGTTTIFPQLAAQAVGSFSGPVDYGPFGTIPLWNDAAHAIHNRIRTVVPDNSPILLTGHSYGAAAACVLAAIYRLAQPDRDICLLTYGCPKPGDDRMIKILDQVNQFHIVDQGDVVAGLPPNVAELGPLLLLIPTATVFAWNAFSHLGESWLLLPDGTLSPGFSDATPSQILADIINWALGLGAFPNVTAHSIDEYVLRLTPM